MGLFSFIGAAAKAVVGAAGSVLGVAGSASKELQQIAGQTNAQVAQIQAEIARLQLAQLQKPPDPPWLAFVKDYGLLLGAGVAAFLLLRKK